MPKNTPRNTPETRKRLFPQYESRPIQFYEFSSVKLYDGETCFRSQNYVSQAEIIYESKGVPFDQTNVSERRTERKQLKWGVFRNQKEISSVPRDQKLQRGHPQDSFTEILEN